MCKLKLAVMAAGSGSVLHAKASISSIAIIRRLLPYCTRSCLITAPPSACVGGDAKGPSLLTLSGSCILKGCFRGKLSFVPG